MHTLFKEDILAIVADLQSSRKPSAYGLANAASRALDSVISDMIRS